MSPTYTTFTPFSEGEVVVGPATVIENTSLGQALLPHEKKGCYSPFYMRAQQWAESLRMDHDIGVIVLKAQICGH